MFHILQYTGSLVLGSVQASVLIATVRFHDVTDVNIWPLIRNHWGAFILRLVSVLFTQLIALFVNVLVLDIVGTTIHSTAITHADDLEMVVSVACHSSIVPVVDAQVVHHKDTVGDVIDVVHPLADQIFTFVVDHAAHHVPKFTVLVVAVAVALPEYVCVIAVVGVHPMFSVVAAPNALITVDTVFITAIVADQIIDVVNVGLVPNTATHVPVSSLNAHASLALVLIPANQISLIRKLVPSYNNW